ncbi:MAG: 50S ribosomal protein L19 [Candidatus Omnitrophica bacterium]|nr:50S ribosomal protein L19 [Candidatus Omnitrophota bacterium]
MVKEIELVEKKYLKKEVPKFGVGDEVRVYIKIKEGDKMRTQMFEGTVIRRRGRGVSETFTVIKEVQGDTIEKIFFIHSPTLEDVKLVKAGRPGKSKRYHLRKKKDIRLSSGA